MIIRNIIIYTLLIFFVSMAFSWAYIEYIRFDDVDYADDYCEAKGYLYFAGFHKTMDFYEGDIKSLEVMCGNTGTTNNRLLNWNHRPGVIVGTVQVYVPPPKEPDIKYS